MFKFLKKKNIELFVLTILIVANSILYSFADGKNTKGLNSSLEGKYHKVAFFGDSRTSDELYNIPKYDVMSYYTYGGMSIDDTYNIVTGNYKADPYLFLEKDMLGFYKIKFDLSIIDEMYNRFEKEAKDYQKIVIQVGINSLPLKPSIFKEKYRKLIEYLHMKSPNATIYAVKCYGVSLNFSDFDKAIRGITDMNKVIDELKLYYDYLNIITGDMYLIANSVTYIVNNGLSDDGLHINHNLPVYYQYIESLYRDADVFNIVVSEKSETVQNIQNVQVETIEEFTPASVIPIGSKSNVIYRK